MLIGRIETSRIARLSAPRVKLSSSDTADPAPDAPIFPLHAFHDRPRPAQDSLLPPVRRIVRVPTSVFPDQPSGLSFQLCRTILGSNGIGWNDGAPNSDVLDVPVRRPQAQAKQAQHGRHRLCSAPRAVHRPHPRPDAEQKRYGAKERCRKLLRWATERRFRERREGGSWRRIRSRTVGGDIGRRASHRHTQQMLTRTFVVDDREHA